MGLAGYGRHSTSLINSIPKDTLLKFNTASIIASLPNFKSDSKLSRKDLLSKNNVDFAALCQSVFELQYLQVVNSLISTAEKTLGNDFKNLVLSGGCALNCPSNSQLAEKYGYQNIYVEPTCTDEGLAVGAAISVQNLIEGRKLAINTSDRKHLGSAYLGMFTEINIDIQENLLQVRFKCH